LVKLLTIICGFIISFSKAIISLVLVILLITLDKVLKLTLKVSPKLNPSSTFILPLGAVWVSLVEKILELFLINFKNF